MFRHDYSDVAMLGKLATRTRAWPVAGLALHAANGAAFGVVYDVVRRRRRIGAIRLALIENTLLFPLGLLVDHRHPARGERGLAPLVSVRGFLQETARHVLFAAVLHALAREERA
jgi:hypothetical protein